MRTQPVVADLGKTAAHCVAGGDTGKPVVAPVMPLCRCVEQVLDKTVMGAEDVGEVRIGLAQFDDQAEEFRQRQAEAAKACRKPEFGEFRLPQAGNRIEWQL